MDKHSLSRKKNVLLTGASGLIGSALSRALEEAGYAVHTLDRQNSTAPFRYIEKTRKVFLDPTVTLHAVINLAGPSLAEGRWTKARKIHLLESRKKLTHALSEALSRLRSQPEIFLSASAIGYYGLTGRNTAGELTEPGNDYLAEVAKQWEAATLPAEQAGINTIHLRMGVVLGRQGGMLKKLLLPYRLGLGGKIGDGSQYLSWISLTDIVGVIIQLLDKNPRINALNLVAEEPVTNSEFSSQLGQTLKRPTLMPMPKFVVKLLFGEMGDTLLLGSTRVKSTKLQSLGIELKHPTLSSALKAELA